MLKDDVMAVAVVLALFQQLTAPPIVAPKAEPKKDPPATGTPKPTNEPRPGTKPAEAKPKSEPQAKPPVSPPTTAPPQKPAQKFTDDEKVGSGDPAAVGDIATIHLEAFDTSGKELMSTRKRGLAFRFELGKAEPILSLVVEGMRSGGIRKALLPKEQIRDGKGLPPLLPADSAIQVRIWLLAREKPKPPR